MRTAFSAIFQKACRSLTFAQYSEQRLLFFSDTAMRIQYASDLHLTFGRNFQYVLSGGIKPEGDVFVLAAKQPALESAGFPDTVQAFP